MLTELERQEIPRYQYRGGDSSLIYKYLLSPLAQACVDYLTPEWMAPNLITLIGLLATLSAAFLTILYNPALSMHHSYRNYDGNSYSNSNSNSNGDGEEDGNSGNSSYGDSTSYGNNNSDSHIRWLYLYTGISILIYQTLDNMDGKQARKTKTSSPLGMLFDHGCDAINAGITAIPIGSVLGTGWSVGIFFSLYCGFVPFYFQTWEEYYSGAMVLPIINGPTEGLLIAVGMCFTSFLFGADWWHQVA